MSELKAFRIIQGDTGGYGAPSYKCDTDGNRLEEWCDICEVYDKSEADKVIAELKADYKEACGRLQTANLIKDEQLAELREATRWRDVEKEPPEIKEESEEVAVLVEYENNYSRGVFVTHSDFYKGVFYETHLDNEINCDYDNDGERCYKKVIKWQPMPKAPEADK